MRRSLSRYPFRILLAGSLALPISGFVPAGLTGTEAAAGNRTQNLPTLTAPSSSLNPRLGDSYLLGPGDVVLINVFNVPEYSGEQTVLIDGTINLPAVGSLIIEGMTLADAQRAIATHLQAELRYPSITLSLLQPRPLRVAITGEISQPGYYSLPMTEQGQFPGLVDIIQRAGGITQSADLTQVVIERVLPGQTGTQRLVTNLAALINDGDLSQNLLLRDGDSIEILATADIDVTAGRQIAASNLSTNEEEPIVVAVVGEVARPGTYNYAARQTSNQSEQAAAANTFQQPGKLTLTRALRLAGGVQPMADLRSVEVRRRTRQGPNQIIVLNLWEVVENGELDRDIVLQTGDTVYVPTATTLTPAEMAQLAATNLAPDTVQVNVVGEVENPGPVTVSPQTTLNQAVLAAGGLNSRAREQVELIRLHPNGTVTQRTIEIDLAQNLNSESNPIIMNNDVVVVRPDGAASLSDSLGNLLGPLLQILPFVNIN
ncbi:MAG: SLBB domain-containing protein [Cyanobacteria bacterium P01_D01_bin.14]